MAISLSPMISIGYATNLLRPWVPDIEVRAAHDTDLWQAALDVASDPSRGFDQAMANADRFIKDLL